MNGKLSLFQFVNFMGNMLDINGRYNVEYYTWSTITQEYNLNNKEKLR